jgi:hypothetical protein
LEMSRLLKQPSDERGLHCHKLSLVDGCHISLRPHSMLL